MARQLQGFLAAATTVRGHLGSSIKKTHLITLTKYANYTQYHTTCTCSSVYYRHVHVRVCTCIVWVLGMAKLKMTKIFYGSGIFTLLYTLHTAN